MFVVGSGMVTAVGAATPASCAALRCKIARFRELNYTDIQNEALIGSPITYIISAAKGMTRILDLAVPALLECAASIPKEALSQTALLIGLASRERPTQVASPPALLAALEQRTDISFSPYSAILTDGALSGLLALQRARTLLAKRQATFCIVGGVDTFLDEPQLRWLERGQRLKRSNNPDGLIPGEAATFIALSLTAGRQPIRTRVAGLGIAKRGDDGASSVRSADIVESMRTAMADAAVSSNDIGLTITDMTGERDLAVDHAIAVTRVFIDSQPKLHFWHPAMSIGAVGAASVPLALAWAAVSALRGYAPSKMAMCSAISEPDSKGIAIVSFEEN